jgi:hypothetical protein
MKKIKIQYIVDEGDLINKPTHFVSVYKGYERLGTVEAETKKEVKKKISKWLVDNKLRTLVIPSIDLRF